MAKDKKKKEKSVREKNVAPLNLTELLKEKEEQLRVKELDFNAIKISLSSPEMIRQRSHGEVKKPETINYRTFKPEFEGLFCERIFGTTKDYECYCGKYKKQRYKGVVCDKCGVEVTESKVRRERMGHIELAVPVVHIWFLKSIPSKLSYLLNITAKNLERVIYYENYIVIDPKKAESEVKKNELINEEEYLRLKEKYGEDISISIGADAIKILLKELDLDKLAKDLRKEIVRVVSLQKKKDIIKRLKVVEAFRKSGNKPEWMVLDVLPVIPPELRPLVQLDGGRFVTSDLNDLYRRIINRNNRLKKLISINSPELIIKNEKRMIQEAVDALFDNGRRGHPVRGARNRPLKSLSDMLKGKQGRFRQNLLGKRVDYSGRSVVVVGPNLKLYQCGIPKKIALELFKPFIINKVQEMGYTIKSAKKMVEHVRAEVWDILEDILDDHLVFLNRAPTLHRHSIQAFKPILVEGNAITLHPLVCGGFNADFDGDQMAVHVPLSYEAQTEAKFLMLSSLNILSPASGKPIIVPNQDIVLGIYYLTKKNNRASNKRMFYSKEEALIAYNYNLVDLHESIVVRMKTKKIETTVGRIIFNQILPQDMEYVNDKFDKKQIVQIVSDIFEKYGTKVTSEVLDKMKELGFRYATLAGFTIGVDDLKIPEEKKKLLEYAENESKKIRGQFEKGIITEGERYNKIIDIWTGVTDKVAEYMLKGLAVDQDGFNPVFMMADSGARGSKLQIRQLAGIRGLMAKPQKKMTGGIGEIIETPIKSNFREGMSVLEYFISTHGARKGLADTALKTADAGYLTRRLVDVAQDVIITEIDCNTINGINITALKEGGETIEPLSERIAWRVALDNVVDLITDEVIVRANELITPSIAKRIEEAGYEEIRVRSVLTCEAKNGLCSKCYGADLTTGDLVELGEAVGIIAAQSIGEPGTQLTLRTFHVGGTASRVIEQSEIKANHDGIARFVNLKYVKDKDGNMIVTGRNVEISIYDENNVERELHNIPYGTILKVKEGDKVKNGDILGLWDLYNIPIFTEKEGKIQFDDIIEGETMMEHTDATTGQKGKFIIEGKDKKKYPHVNILDANNSIITSYSIPVGARLDVVDGDKVSVGQILAKFPRESVKTRDITGGLPRVAELFEARKPKTPAIISEIEGYVHFEETSSGTRKIKIKNESGTEKEYTIPHGKYVNVRENDYVEAGEQLIDGNINPHDILNVKGESAVQEYLLNKIQEVYRLQGVIIHDKHIEIIVRQMMRKIRITEPGDTKFLVDQQVDKIEFKEENEKMEKEKKKPAMAKPLLLGVTKAALSTESWISAASFQETTRILIDAAVNGKVDKLKGLKENVIIGHLISAATGVEQFKKFSRVERKKVTKKIKKENNEEKDENKKLEKT
ncbi:MAG: DNA-directed RNA polymerase subunit beta' [Candidatus Goldbacteria bacterium]|nr:DNA-directed RNA polymerase subunit beta' [Candidatus Goldiibacteriota bacterium]